jgi:hypothetical protein
MIDRWACAALSFLGTVGLTVGSKGCSREHDKAEASHAAQVRSGAKYDLARMKFGAPPATISNERHTGTFAQGDALSADPAVKPLTQAETKEVRLDTTHKVIEIAPGVRFSASQSLPEPFNRSFIGRAWIETSAGPDRGSIIVFLPDRTVLLADCPGSVRISTWGIADNHIRWIEEAIPIEAEVLTPSQNELRLRVVGANRPQSYVLASPPYVPDRAVSRV